jgi:ribosomal protein L37E
VDYKLAKCARCEKLFNKIVSDVCTTCQPDEDADFQRIHDIICRNHDLSANEVAEEAGVPLECVLRMLREGRIERVEDNDEVKCGRCGAPAISVAKRLCKRCLVTLDREWAQAILDMRQRILAKEQSDMNDVQGAVEDKRAKRRQRIAAALVPPMASRNASGRGMAIRERIDKKK